MNAIASQWFDFRLIGTRRFTRGNVFKIAATV